MANVDSRNRYSVLHEVQLQKRATMVHCREILHCQLQLERTVQRVQRTSDTTLSSPSLELAGRAAAAKGASTCCRCAAGLPSAC